MVVTRNIGRLGNNMFQIAASIGYARKYGYEWAADFGNGVSEPYSAIHHVFPNLPKHELHGHRFHEHPNEFCPQHRVHKNECHFDYHPIPDMGPNVAMTGFFQSYKYFEGQDEEIKKVFAVPVVESYVDYVSIHVRRGDYMQHSGSFPPIDLLYIQNALNALHLKTGKSHFKCMVFSDDIQWCKNYLPSSSQFTFEFDSLPTGQNYEREKLSIMASCSHHIIANSTFSWWGAYLGNNPDKIVICPSAETWFGPTAGVKKPVVDLLFPEWIKIPTR